jgi:hypothetical protein
LAMIAGIPPPSPASRPTVDTTLRPSVPHYLELPARELFLEVEHLGEILTLSTCFAIPKRFV